MSNKIMSQENRAALVDALQHEGMQQFIPILNKNAAFWDAVKNATANPCCVTAGRLADTIEGILEKEVYGKHSG